jgi:RecA/RadA recombinase
LFKLKVPLGIFNRTLGSLLRLEQPPAVIVIDSITAALPRSFFEQSVEQVRFGLQYKLATVLLQKYKPKLAKRGVTLFLASQMRQEVGRNSKCYSREGGRPAGGPALAHYCDVRLLLERIEGQSDATGTFKVMVQAMKNRFAPPCVPKTLLIRWGKGFVNESG